MTFGGYGQARHEGRARVCTHPVIVNARDAAHAYEMVRERCFETYPEAEGWTGHVVGLINFNREYIGVDTEEGKAEFP